MRPADQTADFVAEALRAGQSREDIAGALREAGWSAAEIDRALHAWSETDFPLPVPRPRATVSAREAFLYGLVFAALIVVCVNVTILGFDLIDRFLPEPGETDRYRSFRTMRWSIAYLIVFFPVFLFLSDRLERSVRADRSQRRSAVRTWFGYITLLLAVMALLGDLVSVVFALLNGDLTARFLAKTLLVMVTAALVILYVRGVTAEAEDAT